MSRSKAPPTLATLKANPRWPHLEEVVKRGHRDATRGYWDNDQPPGSLRWHAYEIGFELAEDGKTL